MRENGILEKISTEAFISLPTADISADVNDPLVERTLSPKHVVQIDNIRPAKEYLEQTIVKEFET